MYNYLAEVSVLIFSAVLFFNTLSSFSFTEKKNLYFLLCLISVMVSALTNIISINCIENFSPDRILLSSIVTTTYFIFLGLTTFFFACYCYAYVASDKKYGKLFATLYLIPIGLYFVVLILNLKFNLIFRYDLQLGYTRGSLKNITYITMLLYAVLILSVVFCYRKQLSKHIKLVFVAYPFLAIAVSMIQFFSTYFVMTGTTSFSILLLVYLSVQSDMLEYDLQTGLLTERHLENIVRKNPAGYLAVISIENYTQLENAMTVASFNSLMMSVAVKMLSVFGRSAYHLSANRFGVLCNDFVGLKRNMSEFLKQCENVSLENDSVYHVDFIAAALALPTNAEDYDSAKELTNNLLSRLRAKKGQRVIYCQQSYVDELKRVKAIYSILDRELKAESTQFQVYFQPVYSIKENRFVYVEALARLNGTELGDISPAEFIPIAESKGLIERLGNIVFEKVCEFISRNKNIVDAVSVNFSVFQMINPNLGDYIMQTIHRFGIEPNNIIAEITESIFIQDTDLVRKNMLRLSGEGIRFSLDDFGTGYSSFANVLTLPFRTIKIDRSFVLMMEKKSEVEDFIKNLVHIFKDSGLNILVEGVETQVQDEMVKRAEIDFIQGFLYSHPLPEQELLKLFQPQ